MTLMLRMPLSSIRRTAPFSSLKQHLGGYMLLNPKHHILLLTRPVCRNSRLCIRMQPTSLSLLSRRIVWVIQSMSISRFITSEGVPTLHLYHDSIGVLVIRAFLEGQWVSDVEGAVKLVTVRFRPTIGSSPIPSLLLGGSPLASGFLSTLGIIMVRVRHVAIFWVAS
jgi:hypothetical protein